jgi:hypothetical protein
MNIPMRVVCYQCKGDVPLTARKIVWRNEWWGVCCGVEYVLQATLINADAAIRRKVSD